MAEELLIQREGAVLTLTLNRPESRNSLTPGLNVALSAALTAGGADPAVRVVVLTGAGGAFCAGADLKAAMAGGPGAFEAMDTAIDTYHAIIRAIVRAPKPVIAVVDGPAVGFGCDLALACDLRILSDRAYLQEKFVRIGLMPDGGGTFWLSRLVGIGRAMEIILTGDSLPAARCLELGIANRVVPASGLAEEMATFAMRLAAGPPLAFAEVKSALQGALSGTIESALEAEKAGQLRCLRSADCMEGIMAWMEKREPRFEGK